MKTVWVERFVFSLEGGGGYEIALVFFGTTRIDIDPLISTVESDLNTNLAPDEYLFAVPSPVHESLVEQLSQPVAKSFLSRLRDDTSVTVSGYDINGQESIRKTITASEPSKKITPCGFARRGITKIFNSNGGWVASTSSYHFVHPSKRHTNGFLRLANLLVSWPEVVFIAFCCLPFIGRGIKSIYIDTPALFGVVSAINELRRIFDAPALHIENFRSYYGYRSIEDLGTDDISVLISASWTGGLAEAIVNKRNIPRECIAHLLFLGDTELTGRVICDLRSDIDENPEGRAANPIIYEAEECAICRSGSTPIQIEGDNFDFAGPQPESLLIRKFDAPLELAETMSRFLGSRIFATGVGSVEGTGRPEYFIDSEALLSNSKFLDRLTFALTKIVPASCTHVVQVDSYSKGLCEKVKSHIISHSGSAEIVERAEEILSPTDTAIVIVAAVIESGQALADVSHDLRSIAPKSPLTYLVGLEKSSGLARRESLEKTLTESSNLLPHEYVSVERVVLPPSSSENSWDEELNLWRMWLAENPSSDYRNVIKDRIEQLEGSAERITGNLFLTTDQESTLEVQPGFVFWPPSEEPPPSSQADVYFSISSVLQKLRANSESLETKRSIRNNWFHQTRLAPENFTRFNDSLVQAAILRAAKRSELNYESSARESKEMASLTSRIIAASNKPRGGAASEFMLALATERLRLLPDDKKRILVAATSQPGVIVILSEIAQKANAD